MNATAASRISEWVFGSEHAENLYYGHALILRRYARVRLPYRVPGIIQHGWVGDNCGVYGDIATHGERERAAAYFVWNALNLERCRELGYRNAVAIGAPFIYMPAEDAAAAPRYPRGLFLLPAHSCEWTEFTDRREMYRGYIADLEPLLSEFSPVAVSLY